MTADLHDLLEDAVSDVEPRDRLPAIRSRTRRARRRRRGWALAGAAAATAAAAVVAAGVVAVVGPADDGTTGPAGGPGDQVGAAYFVDHQLTGDRTTRYVLRREFRPLPTNGDVPGPLAALMADPVDPDYSTPWDSGAFESARVTGDAIEVETGPTYQRRFVYGERPDSVDLQMVVWTMQAAFDRPDLPVQLTQDGRPLGAPVVRAPEGDVLGDVNISDPAEGETVTGTLTARGRARTPDALVPWALQGPDGSSVLNGVADAEGTDDKLHAWQVDVDVASLPPGTYTFVAFAMGGRVVDAGPRSSDTRTIVVD